MTQQTSRREFLRQSAAFSALGAAAPFAMNLAAMSAAQAQSATDYRALVCIFLFGGNDSANMVLPTDTASWNAYTATRNLAPDPIALKAPGTAAVGSAAAGSPDRLGGVLPITPATAQSGRSFALHPVMTSLQGLFGQGRLAIVPNVGPLVQPLTKADYSNANVPKPAKLFSHNDQQNTWQAFAPEGAQKGWGGLIGDQIAAQNTNSNFTCISAAGNAVWLSGQTTRQYQVSTGGAVRVGTDSSGKVYGSSDVAAAMGRILGMSSGHVLSADVADVAKRAMSAEATLRTALPAANAAPYGSATSPDPLLQYDNPLTGGKSTNGLAQQLQVIARLIGSASTLGMKRQVFFVSLGGFDTHDLQNRSHADLYARLAHGLSYFDTVLGALGMRDQVTTFTASDFGRTFTSNGDGTDHGWGGHHFVMGGSVKGGDIHGRFPTLGVSDGKNGWTSPDQLGNGVFLPTVSVDQYAATMGRWMGLGDTQLATVMPNLKNFTQKDLGFMKA